MMQIKDVSNDIVVKNGEMIVGEQAVEALRMVKNLEEQAKQFKTMADAIKKQFTDAMEKNGVLNFKNDDLTISYIPENTRLSVDTEKMKADGIYKYYLKETPTKATSRWTFKKEKK